MIIELADLTIDPARSVDFERNVHHALKTIFPKAKGFVSHDFRQSVETPGRYVLLLTWQTLENHTVDFRGSADFQEWRALVGHCFASPPEVEHVREVVAGF